jgi:hypothetical protein
MLMGLLLIKGCGYLYIIHYERRFSMEKSKKKKGRCWKGYKPKPGSVPYSKGSCIPESYITLGRAVYSILHEKKTPAWQRKEGQNPTGGLNAKGRSSARAQGHNLKAPQPEGGPRKRSFCARMRGMRKRQKSSNNTGEDRLSLSLKKWKC